METELRKLQAEMSELRKLQTSLQADFNKYQQEQRNKANYTIVMNSPKYGKSIEYQTTPDWKEWTRESLLLDYPDDNELTYEVHAGKDTKGPLIARGDINWWIWITR